MVNAIVVDRPVEPNEGLTLYERFHPLYVGHIDHIDHRITGPHHSDLGISLGSEGLQILALAGPQLIVFRGAHDEWSHVGMALHKVVGEIVEIVGLKLGVVVGYIVEEDGK